MANIATTIREVVNFPAGKTISDTRIRQVRHVTRSP